MLTAVHPKLPMRDKGATMAFYIGKLGFALAGKNDHAEYLMVERDGVELHFFLFKDLDPKENYGQVYIRTNAIDELYSALLRNGVSIHPHGPLQNKPWGQREFALLDPDNNLLTIGQAL